MMSEPDFSYFVLIRKSCDFIMGGIPRELKDGPSANRNHNKAYRLCSASEARRSPLGFQLAQEDSHQHAVVAYAAQPFQFSQSLRTAFSRSKRAFGGHIDVSVGNRQNSRPQRYLLPLKARRITGSIKRLVVMLNRFLHHFASRLGADNLASDLGMRFYKSKFFIAQRTGLVENAFGYKDLSDVMHTGDINEIVDFLQRQSQSLPYQFGITSHRFAMSGSVQFSRLSGT